MLALAALMIITITSVNQQRSNMMIQQKMYVREFENAATDYARKRTEEIWANVAFDESRIGATDIEVDKSLLTAAASFGAESGENALADFDDIDDYHGFTEDVTHVLSADTFRFSVDYTVRYVDPANPTGTAGTPTLVKELSITVASRDSIGNHAATFTNSKTRIASEDQ